MAAPLEVAATALLATLVVAAAAAALDEVHIMLSLRAAVHAADARYSAEFSGWQPDEPAHPCAWSLVECDSQEHIVRITLAGTFPYMRDATNSPRVANNCTGCSVLLPELAQLQWLSILEFMVPLQASIPAEWGRPGAFPSLKQLNFLADFIAGPLPDIQPGALPHLQVLSVQSGGLRSVLPASWGSRADVLPSLRALRLGMRMEGSLPVEWAAGFHHLAEMSITNDAPEQRASAQHIPSSCPAAGASASPSVHLPPAWGVGGFRSLKLLSLVGLGLNGPLPTEWTNQGFPELVSLDLSNNCLTGTLGRQLLSPKVHPHLKELQLSNNQLSDTLPAEWASSEVEIISLMRNHLTGPAFPPAWLQPGAMPALHTLELAHNTNLGGSLPSNLSWPSLLRLFLGATSIGGSIPQHWCEALLRNRSTALNLWVEHTRVNPNLPSCAASISLIGFEDAAHKNGMAATNWMPTHLMLLAISVLVAGTTVLFVVARCSRPVAVAGQQPVYLQISAYEQGGSSSSTGCTGHVLQHAGMCSNSQHLAEVLASELKAPAGRQPIKVVPASVIASAIHNSMGPQRAGKPNWQAPYWRPLLATRVAHSLASTECSTVSGTPTGTRTGSSSAATGSDATSGSVVEAGLAAMLADWRWQTWIHQSTRWPALLDSLQVHMDDLMFYVDSRGTLTVVGEGGRAIVYLASLGGLQVAVKLFSMESTDFWLEVLMLHTFRHPRIVPVYGVAAKGHVLMLVMELMEGGSLQSAMNEPQTQKLLRWHAKGQQLALDVAEGLAFLHSHRVIHGDIKPSNVLLSADWRACLADLGLANKLATRVSRLSVDGGTWNYAAPEQLMGERVCLSADMYSFGIVLAEMLTGGAGDGLRGRRNVTIPRTLEGCPQEVAVLIEECLCASPLERPTAQEALQRLRKAAGIGGAG